MADQSDFPTMEELMARVGFLLLNWGWLENDTREAGRRISKLGDEPDLAFVRDIRNLVAHGMNGASADPNRGGEAFLMCRSSEGDEERVTYADMGAAIDAINAHRASLRERKH